MTEFGVIKPLPLRSIWPHEATSFTPWLSQHLNALGETLEMDLELVQSEASVGAFSCEVLARETGTNRNVVIENQLEATDHSHLGQLLTYAAGHNAGAIVWIAREIRDEHEAALIWLNQHTDGDTDFFGIVVSVIQIDDSRPAFTFKLVVRPNDWQKRALEDTNKVASPRWNRYRQFFQKLIDELRNVHRFTNASKAQAQSWYNFSAGVSGFSYALSFAANARVRVELYIDYGDANLNKAILDTFHADRDAIESGVGFTLEWERLEAKRASRIALYRHGSIESSPDELEQIHQWAVKELLQFKKVFGARLSTCLEKAESQVAANSSPTEAFSLGLGKEFIERS